MVRYMSGADSTRRLPAMRTILLLSTHNFEGIADIALLNTASSLLRRSASFLFLTTSGSVFDVPSRIQDDCPSYASVSPVPLHPAARSVTYSTARPPELVDRVPGRGGTRRAFSIIRVRCTAVITWAVSCETMRMETSRFNCAFLFVCPTNDTDIEEVRLLAKAFCHVHVFEVIEAVDGASVDIIDDLKQVDDFHLRWK